MQNSSPNFKQNPITFEKPSYLSQKLKTLTSSNYNEFNIFCWHFAHVSYLPLSYKSLFGIFLFCLDLELFAKIKKLPVFTHSFFAFLLLNFKLYGS